MQIRVDYQCGTPYEFEVEPVNGAMPCAIACPTCGADGTELSNQFIAQHSAAPPPPAPLAAGGGLRIRKEQAPAAPAAPEHASEAPPPPMPPPRGPAYREFKPEKPVKESDENMPLVVLGGAIAGAIGMAAWYFISITWNLEIGYVAWAVGVLTGVGVKVVGRGSTPMAGYVAAVCAALAILVADFLVVNSTVNKLTGSISQKVDPEKVYAQRMAAAKEAVSLQTDDEIKAWLEKHDEVDGKATAKDVEEFRQQTLKEMQDFVNGKPSKEEFMKDAGKAAAALGQLTSFSFKFKIFQSSLSLFTILWLFLGVASAYRIGSQ